MQWVGPGLAAPCFWDQPSRAAGHPPWTATLCQCSRAKGVQKWLWQVCWAKPSRPDGPSRHPTISPRVLRLVRAAQENKNARTGLAQFHRAVAEVASGWASLGFDNTNQNAIKQTSSKFHANAFSAGFQFTEYRAPNNIHVMLEVDPMYDDKVRNKILHPDGGVAESYRYDILYIGSMEEPNIQKVKVRGSDELRGYMAGIRDPYTGRRGGTMQLMEDSATMTALVEGVGSLVKDASRTASLIPSLLN